MKYDKFKVKAFHTFHNPTSASGTWLRYDESIRQG